MPNVILFCSLSLYLYLLISPFFIILLFSINLSLTLRNVIHCSAIGPFILPSDFHCTVRAVKLAFSFPYKKINPHNKFHIENYCFRVFQSKKRNPIRLQNLLEIVYSWIGIKFLYMDNNSCTRINQQKWTQQNYSIKRICVYVCQTFNLYIPLKWEGQTNYKLLAIPSCLVKTTNSLNFTESFVCMFFFRYGFDISPCYKDIRSGFAAYQKV